MTTYHVVEYRRPGMSVYRARRHRFVSHARAMQVCKSLEYGVVGTRTRIVTVKV